MSNRICILDAKPVSPGREGESERRQTWMTLRVRPQGLLPKRLVAIPHILSACVLLNSIGEGPRFLLRSSPMRSEEAARREDARKYKWDSSYTSSPTTRLQLLPCIMSALYFPVFANERSPSLSGWLTAKYIQFKPRVPNGSLFPW